MFSQGAFEQAILLNREAFASLRDEIRGRYTGQYVVLGDGKLLASAPTYDEAVTKLRQLPLPPDCYFIFEADEEPDFEVFTDY
jgi:Family of unknown function (DUF5678)